MNMPEIQVKRPEAVVLTLVDPETANHIYELLEANPRQIENSIKLKSEKVSGSFPELIKTYNAMRWFIIQATDAQVYVYREGENFHVAGITGDDSVLYVYADIFKQVLINFLEE